MNHWFFCGKWPANLSSCNVRNLFVLRVLQATVAFFTSKMQSQDEAVRRLSGFTSRALAVIFLKEQEDAKNRQYV
jgi:CRISPR/Cas system CMR-associated protein Cmr5 small subunit